MPLDWLFGSKKKSEPDPSPPAEDKTNVSGDGFVIVEDQSGPTSDGSNGMYPQLPYALAPKSQTDSRSPVSNEQGSSPHEVTAALGFLGGVPFKLTTLDTFEGIDSATAHYLKASQLISFVSESIASDLYSYDFQVEKSVLHEAGCRDLG